MSSDNSACVEVSPGDSTNGRPLPPRETGKSTPSCLIENSRTASLFVPMPPSCDPSPGSRSTAGNGERSGDDAPQAGGGVIDGGARVAAELVGDAVAEGAD